MRAASLFVVVIASLALTGCPSPPAPERRIPQSTDVRVVDKPNFVDATYDYKAEISVALNEKTGATYVATVAARVTERDPGPGCIIGKGIRVFQGTKGRGYLGHEIGGLENIGPNPGTWFTDPWLAVASGTVYLTYLEAVDAFDVPCGSDRATARADAGITANSIIHIWWYTPSPSQTGFSISRHLQVANDPALDRPITVASDKWVVVSFQAPAQFAIFERLPNGDLNYKSTHVCQEFEAILGGSQLRTIGIPTPALWGNTLFIGGEVGRNNSTTTSPSGAWTQTIWPSVVVAQAYAISDDGMNATYVAQSSPVITAAQVSSGGLGESKPDESPQIYRSITMGTDPNLISHDPTVAMAVEQLNVGGNLEPQPRLFMVYRVPNFGPNNSTPPNEGIAHLQLANILTDQIANSGAWKKSAISRNDAMRYELEWAPMISVDPDFDFVDISSLRLASEETVLNGPAEIVDSALVRPYVTRYYPAHDLASPQAWRKESPLTTNALRFHDLPHRSPFAVSGDVPNANAGWPGDYFGVVAFGADTYTAWPQLPENVTPGTASIDADVWAAPILTHSGSTYTLNWPDSYWQCDCNCPGTSGVRQVVGCVAGGVNDSATVCESVCQGGICGLAMNCLPQAEPSCQPATTLRAIALSDHTCSLKSKAGSGPKVADFGDFFIADSGDSTALLHVDGNAAESAIRGGVSVNMTNIPPYAGTTIEIARANLFYGSFYVGGSLDASIDNLSVMQQGRLYGTFTDATHFVISAHDARFTVRLGLDPVGPSWWSGDTETHRFLATNDNPLNGTFDIATGAFTLHIAVGDATNNIDATFYGNVTMAPPDSDADGIVDAIDNCPTTANLDQTDGPPVFGPVAEMTVHTCTPGEVVTLIPPDVSDSCTPNDIQLEALLVSVNGQLAHPTEPGVFLRDYQGVLPSGKLVIEWTATDGNGHSASVTQTVNVVPQPALYANGNLDVDDYVITKQLNGSPASIANAGSGHANVGAHDWTGDVLTMSPVMIEDSTTVNGFVQTASTYSQQGNVTVTGSVIQGVAPVLPEYFAPTVSFPPLTVDATTGPNKPIKPLAPGAYRLVKIEANASYSFRTGVYHINALQMEPNSSIRLDLSTGPIDIFIKSSLIFRGQFTSNNGSFEDFTLGYFGSNEVFIERPFVGLITAPNAKLNLSSQGAVGHKGSFFARDIEVHSNTTLWHVPYGCSTFIEVAPSCTDGVKNGSESSIDCGGSCPACANGATCTKNADCLSNYCASGVCTAPPTSCTVASAIDLGTTNTVRQVADNACLKVTQYPGSWVHAVVLQTQGNGFYPIPYDWTHCSASGSGVFESVWTQRDLRPVTDACTTLIRLKGSGTHQVSLAWWGNG